MITTSSSAPARRTVLASIGAATMLLASVGYSQTRQAEVANGRVAGNAAQAPAAVNPQSMSCSDLKAQVKTTGELSIVAGPGAGWGDTFYGPGVPRCQFYQMPQFAYVRARDGLCGVGFICVDKLSMD